MSETTGNWPPGLFAVMQDGDGTPEYFRPWRYDQSLEEFIDEMALISVRGIASSRGTAFVHVISSETGETDEAMTILVEESMQTQRQARQA
ncbi:MAG: hypothetical protein ACXWLH_01035 [Candidatus Saccharimonadales bacterium]